MEDHWYFCISSNTSRCSPVGLTPGVHVMRAREIVNLADDYLGRHGECMENMRGIGWVDDENGGRFDRELTFDEQFDCAIEALNDDGRLFECWSMSAAGAACFSDAAAEYHLQRKADALIDEWMKN